MENSWIAFSVSPDGVQSLCGKTASKAASLLAKNVAYDAMRCRFSSAQCARRRPIVRRTPRCWPRDYEISHQAAAVLRKNVLGCRRHREGTRLTATRSNAAPNTHASTSARRMLPSHVQHPGLLIP